MNPTFSIIIPTYNRPDQLRQCLESLTRLEYPWELFEVVVIDDGSPVPLSSIVDSFADSLSTIYLRQDNQGPAAARNHGIARASNEFIAFTDDDCQPEPQWLTQLAEQLMKTPDRIVGGKTVNALASNIYSEASQMIIDIVYDHYNANHQDATFSLTTTLL